MAALLFRLTGSRSSTKYEPLPRSWHISECIGSKVLVQGGLTKDISEKSRQHLSTVVEIFDPYSELWEQKQVKGDSPRPGIYHAASASLHDDLFSFGGFCDCNFFDTLHRLDTKTWHWYQLSPENADGAPMPKAGCGMISFRNSLAVFGGVGMTRGPTEPYPFIIDTRFTDGRGWTNEFHIYNLSKGRCTSVASQKASTCMNIFSNIQSHCERLCTERSRLYVRTYRQHHVNQIIADACTFCLSMSGGKSCTYVYT